MSENWLVRWARCSFGPLTWRSKTITWAVALAGGCWFTEMLHVFIPCLFACLCLAAAHLNAMTAWLNVIDFSLDVASTMWRHARVHGTRWSSESFDVIFRRTQLDSRTPHYRGLAQSPCGDGSSMPFVVDFVADTGDGLASTRRVAEAIVQKTVNCPGKELPRADYVIFGGDLAYPQFAEPYSSRRFVDLYSEVWNQEESMEHAWAYFLVGNHDYLDDCETFNQFIKRGAFGKWRIGNRVGSACFVFKVYSWVFIGCTFAPTDDLQPSEVDEILEMVQHKFFGFDVSQLGAHLNFVVVGHRPFWLLEGNYYEKDRLVEGLNKAGLVRLFLAGDLHNFSHWKLNEDMGKRLRQHGNAPHVDIECIEKQAERKMSHRLDPVWHATPSDQKSDQWKAFDTSNILEVRVKGDTHYIVSGGGGAFLHPTCRRHHHPDSVPGVAAYPKSNWKYRFVVLAIPFLQPFLTSFIALLFLFDVPAQVLSMVGTAVNAFLFVSSAIPTFAAVILCLFVVVFVDVVIDRIPFKPLNRVHSKYNVLVLFVCLLLLGSTFGVVTVVISRQVRHVSQLLSCFLAIPGFLWIGWSCGLGLLDNMTKLQSGSLLKDLLFSLSESRVCVSNGTNNIKTIAFVTDVFLTLAAILVAAVFFFRIRSLFSFWMTNAFARMKSVIKIHKIFSVVVVVIWIVFEFYVVSVTLQPDWRPFVSFSNCYRCWYAMLHEIVYGIEPCWEKFDEVLRKVTFALLNASTWMIGVGCLYCAIVLVCQYFTDLADIDEQVFSILKIADAKNFIRMIASKDELRLVVLVLDEPESQWRVHDEVLIPINPSSNDDDDAETQPTATSNGDKLSLEINLHRP
jgi:hypothetical protein